MYACVHTHTHTHTQKHMYSHPCTHTHTHTNTHTDIHTHARAPTHTKCQRLCVPRDDPHRWMISYTGWSQIANGKNKYIFLHLLTYLLGCPGFKHSKVANHRMGNTKTTGKQNVNTCLCTVQLYCTLKKRKAALERITH